MFSGATGGLFAGEVAAGSTKDADVFGSLLLLAAAAAASADGSAG